MARRLGRPRLTSQLPLGQNPLMVPFSERGDESLPEADERFFRVFVPYELRLAQRRALEWGNAGIEQPLGSYLGFYLVRLLPAAGGAFPSRGEDGERLAAHVQELLRTALRTSDVSGRLTDAEHLAVLRDLDPMQAYVVAQRFLSAAAQSQTLTAAGIWTRVGYVVYPLSAQANLPPERWTTLLDLARRISDRGSPGPATGYGILRGPQGPGADLPETDLIPLAFEDIDSLVKAGLLSLQRIHLLPGG